MIAVLCFQGALLADQNQAVKETLIQRLEDLTTAINQDKEDVLSSFWTEEGEYTDPRTGEVLEGKEKIAKFLKARVNEIHNRQLHFSFKPEKIELSDPNTAVVEGVSEISDKEGLLLRNARKVELVKQDGQWYVDSISEVEVPPAPPVYNHLKELEWLIGKWKDQDPDVTTSFATTWDTFRNFIVQRFKIEIYGVDELEGIQIIGWDAIEQKIRSWVFDSDGGFGNGVWSKNGTSWIAKMDYSLSEGKKASSTYVYTPTNSESYIFSATNRTVAGQPLPDIEPVKIVKEESR